MPKRGDHNGDGCATQRLIHSPKRFPFASRANHDESIERNPVLTGCGRIEVSSHIDKNDTSSA